MVRTCGGVTRRFATEERIAAGLSIASGGIGDLGAESAIHARRNHTTGSHSSAGPDYPASTDFPTAIDGVNDASAHIRSMAASCPNTKLVLGGFSQGAAVMGFVTANVIPDGAPATVPNPMPPDVANHVAAVALFGKPSTRFMRAINEPVPAICGQDHRLVHTR